MYLHGRDRKSTPSQNDAKDLTVMLIQSHFTLLSHCGIYKGNLSTNLSSLKIKCTPFCYQGDGLLKLWVKSCTKNSDIRWYSLFTPPCASIVSEIFILWIHSREELLYIKAYKWIQPRARWECRHIFIHHSFNR